MCCNFPTIKITEGNAFTLIFPLKLRSYVAERPIDKDIDVTRLSNVHVTLGGVEYAPTIETYGVRIDVPATLVRGTYDGLLTADYDGNAIRGAYESCVQIVAWNAQSNAQQYILSSPVATNAAYVLGYMPTDTEVEALKQQLRDQIAAAKHAEAEAIAEKERYAEAIEHLDDIAKQGDDPEVSLTSLSEIIEGLDISKVAKQGTDRTATNTAIRDKVDEIIATIGGEADVNAVYLGLLNRQTDYQAEGFPGQQDLPHLPQAVAAFTPRKIQNGSAPNDGILDGISLVHLLCEPASVVELKDDNVWGAINGSNLNKLPSLFPNASKLRVGGSSLTYSGQIFNGNTSIKEMNFDEIHTIKHTTTIYIWGLFYNMANLEVATFHNLVDGMNDPYSCLFNTAPKLKTIEFGKVKKLDGVCWNCGEIEEINIPTLEECSRIAIDCDKLKRVVCEGLTSITGGSYNPSLLANNPLLEYAYVPNITSYKVHGAWEGAGSMQNMPSLAELHIGKAVFTNRNNDYLYALKNCGSLIKLVIYGDLNQNIYLNSWNPTDKGTTFLSNFQTYIADRVADRTGQTALRLTLSAAVYEALQAQEDQTILATLTNKNWTVASA